MEFRRLKYFLTVVEHLSFSSAATELHISQPSLSIAIKKLESDLGLVLIDRSTRQFRITEEGEVLYKEAKQILNHYDLFINRVKMLKNQGAMNLTIGFIQSAKNWIQSVLQTFKQEFPDVQINIIDAISSYEVEDALNNFKIHLIITNQYIDDVDIQTIPLFEEKFVAVLPSDHPLKSKKHIRIEDLKNEPIIVNTEGLQSRKDVLSAFHKAGVRPNIQYEVERFEMACTMVENGFGITLVPKYYINAENQANYFIREIQNHNASRTVYLAFNKNRYIPPVVLRFMELVRIKVNMGL